MYNEQFKDANLFNAGSILFHSYLLCRALKAEERLDIQTSFLFKARPVLTLWVNLWKTNKNTLWMLKL